MAITILSFLSSPYVEAITTRKTPRFRKEII